MAVITKFFIVRNGVELDLVFEEKKEADAYDKMLDAAENLAEFIKQGDLKSNLDEKTLAEVCVYLSKNAPEVNRILKGLKPLGSAASSSGKPEKPARTGASDEKKSTSGKSGTGPGKK